MDDNLAPPIGDDDHIAGNVDAAITLVEYGDFECSFCGAAYPIVKRILQTLGDRLCFVFRHFPLAEAHPHAELAAEASEASGAQGAFWDMHDMLYEHQDALELQDLLEYAKQLELDDGRVADELARRAWRNRVRTDFKSGIRSGVNGTPSFFINGVRFDGDWSNEAEFLAALSAVGAP